jgi:hypothetical protein
MARKLSATRNKPTYKRVARKPTTEGITNTANMPEKFHGNIKGEEGSVNT